jgi:hypothetical protein
MLDPRDSRAHRSAHAAARRAQVLCLFAPSDPRGLAPSEPGPPPLSPSASAGIGGSAGGQAGGWAGACGAVGAGMGAGDVVKVRLPGRGPVRGSACARAVRAWRAALVARGGEGPSRSRARDRLRRNRVAPRSVHARVPRVAGWQHGWPRAGIRAAPGIQGPPFCSAECSRTDPRRAWRTARPRSRCLASSWRCALSMEMRARTSGHVTAPRVT